MCELKVWMFLVVVLVFTFAITYVYNVRIENMKVKYDCPEKLSKTNEGLFKLSFPNDKSPPKLYYNLEEYVNVIKWQKENKLNCPILALQSTTQEMPADLSQNEEKIQLLIDANRDDSIYNSNLYPGFDAHNQFIGVKTPLDLMESMEENKPVSANAMDSNWGGNEYTKKLVDSGFYKENT